MTEQCSTCRFWDAYEGKAGGSRVGDCRRHPPRIVDACATRAVLIEASSWIDKELLYEASCFPVTDEESWCGEYQPAVERLAI